MFLKQQTEKVKVSHNFDIAIQDLKVVARKTVRPCQTEEPRAGS
jgi:hypothetical protein